MNSTPNLPAETPHRYSADRPLESISDDQLQRADFAQRLAADITGWHGKDSLVISINGAWGSGKTTLKNFICEKLKAKGRPIVVEFNPWSWSGQDKLAEGFFGTLRSRFRETDNAAETEALAERWEAWERWTKFGAEISDTVGKSLAPLFGGSVILTLLTNNAPYSWLRFCGVTLGVIGVVSTSFLAAFPGIATHMVTYARHKAGKAHLTMAQLRVFISAQLERLRAEKRPVVVMVDDIDRLDADEIRYLFQLVKVNADFPNLVFLLLFDTAIVTKALSAVSSDSGEEYLKKIVQVPMDLPTASRAHMESILINGLNQIINGEKVKIRWDRDRFHDLFEDNLWPYFRTLRDVKRFLGTFDFYYHGQIENGVLQVNAVDLLAIEVLRTFDHEAYVCVRDVLGINLRKNLLRALSSDVNRRTSDEIERIASLAADEAHQERLRRILYKLFPDVSGQENQHAERDLRVCHPEHFSRFFAQTADRKSSAPTSMHNLFGIMGERQKFTNRLRELITSGEVEAVLEKVTVYFEEIPANVGNGFIGGLFDAGDDFPEGGVGMFRQSPDVLAGRMVGFFLKKLPDSASRAKLLECCLATTPSYVVPTIAIGLLETNAGKKKNEALILETDLAPLRTVVLSRIKALAATGAIWSSRHFSLFMYRWRDWASQEEVNSWLETALDTPRRKAEFVGAMTQRSIINGSRIEHYVNGKLLETFVSIEAISADIADIAASELTKHQALARNLLARAVKLKAEGHGYSEVRERGDFDPEPTADE